MLDTPALAFTPAGSFTPQFRRSLLALVLAACILPVVRPAVAVLEPVVASLSSTSTALAGTEDAREAYANLPLSFVPNRGQVGNEVLYSAQAGGFSVQFTQTEARLAFVGEKQGHLLNLQFVGANRASTVVGSAPAPGKVNYLIGSDPAGWQTGLPTFGEVVYRDLWPGIDMAFRGAAGALKYEFHVRPGANPDAIRLAYAGAEGLSLGKEGTLVIKTSSGALEDATPQSFQLIDGKRVPVESSYLLAGNVYGFAVGRHNRTEPLVIDPGLAYSTYLGGSGLGGDQGYGIAVDSSGNAYVTGLTGSTDFPTTPGAFDNTFNGVVDAFVTKLNPAGSAPLLYSTYLGGSGGEFGSGIAVDAAGNVYVTGHTDSTDFPTTPGAFDTSHNGGADGFVTKLNPVGSAPLLYSTYLGGASGTETDLAIAVDASGNAYVTGSTGSTDFPTTPGAFDTSYDGIDAFVTKLNAAGSAPLLYSTYLGGSGFDQGFGIAVDASGGAYATGLTGSTDFPTTAGAFDTSHNGGLDAFVTKLNAVGSAPLLYSTFLGGSDSEGGFGIAVDPSGNAYVTGVTASTDFPTTAGTFDTSYNGGVDAFVTKLNPAGSAPLLYSTYLGGSDFDQGFGIAVDPSGNAYVAGYTLSSNFPTTPGAFDTSYNGGSDAFVTKLNPAGSAPLLYSTYLGGSGNEEGAAIAVDASGNAYVTGLTSSSNFPTTPGAFDTSYNGGGDAFVTKLIPVGVSGPATVTLMPTTATNDVGTQHTVTATVTDSSGAPVPGVTVRFTVTGSVSTSGSCTTNTSGQCSFTYQGPELPGADAITAYADTDNDGTQDPGEPSGAATKVWILPTSTPFCDAKVTDGGRIRANNGDIGTFGGNAQSDGEGDVQGQQEYRDHGPAQPQRVKSIQIIALTCTEDRTRASIFGTATIDGSGTHSFRIDIQDLGEPGRGIDTYRILLDTGYDSGEHTLEGGNIQIF